MTKSYKTAEHISEARRQGMLRKLARPQAPVDIKVLAAAWARGWTIDQIAFAAGISRQRVSQRLIEHERKCGPLERGAVQYPERSAAQTTICCDNCGKPYWISAAFAARQHKGKARTFCSMRCYCEGVRMITDEMVEQAIDMRWTGKAWGSIAIELGHPIQSIQMRMWKHLYVIGMLDRQTVESIWRSKSDGRRAGWNWLERTTGLIATEHGAVLGRKVYVNAKPWGRSLDRMLHKDAGMHEDL